jgi:two-component SAPR family response regulator
LQQSITTKERLKKAKGAEAAQQLEEAAEIYEQILKEDNLEVEAYDRLMMVYRKLKDYKNELSVVDRGIKVFHDF